MRLLVGMAWERLRVAALQGRKAEAEHSRKKKPRLVRARANYQGDSGGACLLINGRLRKGGMLCYRRMPSRLM